MSEHPNLSHRQGGPARRKKHGPRPSSRNIEIRLIEELPGGLLMFTLRSYDPEFGLEDVMQIWNTCYDQETGLVWCNCPRNIFDLDPVIEEMEHWPTLLTPVYQCKHLRHILGVLWRSGRIRPVALARALWFETTYGTLSQELLNYELCRHKREDDKGDDG